MLGVTAQKRRVKRRGGIAKPDRPIIAGDIIEPRRLLRDRPDTVKRVKSDPIAELKQRLEAIEVTIVEIGRAAEQTVAEAEAEASGD